MIYHGFLDWDKFGLRVAQKDMPRLPQILLAISEEELSAKQKALSQIWHR